MIWFPAPQYVVSRSMTVIAAVLHPDGLVICGDRASVNPLWEATPGIAAMRPDVTKVLLLPGGLVVAVAGQVVSSDGTADVLAEVRRLGAQRTEPARLAVQLSRVLEAHAPALRADVAPLDTSRLPEVEEAITMVLIAGVTTGGPELWEVTLRRASVSVSLVQHPGKIIGPVSCMPGLEEGLKDAAGKATLDGVYETLRDTIAAASRREWAYVSLDVDAVLLHADGRVEPREHRHPVKPVIGRH